MGLLFNTFENLLALVILQIFLVFLSSFWDFSYLHVNHLIMSQRPMWSCSFISSISPSELVWITSTALSSSSIDVYHQHPAYS